MRLINTKVLKSNLDRYMLNKTPFLHVKEEKLKFTNLLQMSPKLRFGSDSMPITVSKGMYSPASKAHAS